MVTSKPVFQTREPSVLTMNISAYRVLFLLLLLVRYRSLTTDEINRHVFEDPLIARHYPFSTILKYINSLRMLGYDISSAYQRRHNGYRLPQHPFPVQVSEEEQQVVSRLALALEQQGSPSLVKSFHLLWEDISWGLQLPGKTLPQSNDGALREHKIAFLNTRRSRMQLLRHEYERYCEEGHVLSFDYLPDTVTEQASTALVSQRRRDVLSQDDDLETHVVEPYDVIEQDNTFFLVALDRKKHHEKKFNLLQIRDLRQLASKNRQSRKSVVVVFSLYGRLAKSYRLYAQEKVVYQSPTAVHVKAVVKDVDALILRLMKYGESCQVLSPDPVREAVASRLKQMLECV